MLNYKFSPFSDNLVKDLNNGAEPKALALAIKALAAKEADEDKLR